MRQKFIDAVETGNLISVRYSLSNELLLDPRGGSYREMKALAEERIKDLYEPLDGELSQKAAEDYTEAELMELKNMLDANFCKERLELYEQVVAVVLREKAEQMDREGTGQTAGHAEQAETADMGKYEGNQHGTEGVGCHVTPTAIGVAAGIVAGGIAKAVGAATGTAVGIAVAAGAAAGAAVKYLKDNDREDEEI